MVRTEGSQGIGLVLEAGDDLEQVQYAEDVENGATRTEESQAATPALEGSVCCGDDAEAGTIDLGEVGHIQEHVADTDGEQVSEVAVQQSAFTVIDGRPSIKIQYGDVAALPG